MACIVLTNIPNHLTNKLRYISHSYKSPSVARALRYSGLGGLEVKSLTRNVRDVGLNPTWFHFLSSDV